MPDAARRPPRRWLTAYAMVVYLFLLAPLAIVIIVSFGASDRLEFPPTGFSLRWYSSFFASDQLLGAFLLSLRIAAFATVGAVVLGVASAVVIVRHGKLRGIPTIRSVFYGPLIVPYVILAQGLFHVNLELGLYGSVTSIVVAHLVVALPYVVVLLTAALYSVPKTLEDAARGLGAGGFAVFRRITLPLIRPSILSASLFAFIVSWDEFILAYFLAAPDVQTLPVVTYNLLREKVDPTISAVSTLLIVMTAAAVLAADYLQRIRTTSPDPT